ncbi:oligogalacturonate-specific porin KdgM family protein [Shewanella intestini]|uniref:DUF481 domain-containing protein n=1 Tax=Shewanella intestini TaxID=2017544 RepID=A0ABS5I584_9GAMM|nr:MULTISPECIES: oligogalacturonate-specific porin KdgM family protein [Shewanella]MBR9729174.1 DUF481 domain-containing protein [Shewanella intestini]MRG37255.1 DUF481 domain-containing protein [Shewanella sp. XMDDZSB0408]
MKSNLITLVAVGLALLSPNAMATSIDFRHEYKHSTDRHASRVKIGHTFDKKYAVSLELKYKGKDAEFMKDLHFNGAELAFGYKLKLNDQWTLSPGLPIEVSSSGNKTYKPQLRLTYYPGNIQGLSISGRYRLDMKPSEDIKRLRHRFTTNIGYKYQNWSLGLEGNYYYADHSDYILFNNKRTNYETNLTAHYKAGKWTPWVEFGDVLVDSHTSQRELRSRVGIRYSF